VVAWANESVTYREGHRMSRAAIYSSYQTWCITNGRSAVSTKRFWPRLREVLAEQQLSFEEVRSGTRQVEGLVVDA
jgi:hypothetical protein